MTRRIYEDNRAQTRAKNYASFTSGFEQIRGRVGGLRGQAVDSSINNFFKRLESAGGSRIGNADLSKAIADFQRDLGRIASTTTGVQGDLLRDLVHDLKEANRNAKEGGLEALGGNSKDFIKTAFGFKADNTIDEAKNDLAKQIKRVATGIADPALKQALNDVRAELYKTANSAKNAAEKQQAVADAAAKLQGLGASATGADKAAMDGLAKNASKNTNELKKALSEQEKSRRWQGLNNGIANLNHAIGSSLKYLQPLKRTFDVGNAVFQQVNSKFNQFARMQMKIASERGAFGRVMRGAGMDFSSMMSALGTGRRAGMEDREVVDKMATMQEQLARARWGEGPIIENLGKWGLTPFDENGNMKDFKRVMIDISNKFNTLGSDMERLQFLSMQGFKPEQMEFVKNYARDARNWEELKKHPERMGVLEQARYLDESGMYAKADTATKIELKRRQILNQNAIDEGIWEGFKRSINPENWFFSDWTARQQGVRAAKSEKAMEDLTSELARVRGTIKDGRTGIAGLNRSISGFGEEVLQNLSLTEGWAAADLANKGSKSVVHDLREIYAKQLGLENLDSVEKRNKAYNAGIGGLGGAGFGMLAGGLALALAGAVASPWTGGTSLLGTKAGLAMIMASGVIGGIAGANAAYESPLFDLADDGSLEHINALRRLAKSGDRQSIARYLSEHKLWGLDADVINSEDFQNDKKASKILQGAKVADVLMTSQARTDKTLNIEDAMRFNEDEYYLANKAAIEATGRKLNEEDISDAMIRTGTSDKSFGVGGREAYNYIRYGYDKYSKANQTAIRNEKYRLGLDKANVGKTDEELTRMAEEKVEKDFYSGISTAEYQKAREYAEGEETQRKVRKEAEEDAAKEYDRLMKDYQWPLIDIGKGANAARELEMYSTRKKDRLLGIRDEFDRDEYIRNKSEALYKQRMTDIDKQMFGEEGRTFKYKNDEEQRRELLELLSRKELGETEKSAKKHIASVDLEKAFLKAKEDLKDDETFAALTREEQNEIISERAKAYAEADRQEAIRAIDLDAQDSRLSNGMSIGGRLARIARQKGVSIDLLRNRLYKSEEVDEIEEKLEKGDEIDAATKDKFEEYKKGSDYRNRLKKKEEERKKKEEEKRRRSEELDGFRAMEQVGIELTAADIERKRMLEKEFGATEIPAIIPSIIPAIKMAEARGGVNIDEKFAKADVEKYRAEEAKRREAFVKRGLGSEEQYEDYKSVEGAILRGEEVSKEDRDFYNETKQKLDKAAEKIKQTEFKPLNEEYVPTDVEAAAEKDTFENARIAAEEGAAMKKRGDLNKLSDMRRIDNLKKKGWSYERIRQNFGNDRKEEYQAAVAAGEYEDHDNDISKTGLSKDEEENITAVMREKSEGVSQVSAKMSQAGESAETAAASAKKAEGAIVNADNSVTINMGGQQITQNIQGAYPMDQGGMRNGTLEGAEEICEMAVQRVTDAVNSVTKSKGSY